MLSVYRLQSICAGAEAVGEVRWWEADPPDGQEGGHLQAAAVRRPQDPQSGASHGLFLTTNEIWLIGGGKYYCYSQHLRMGKTVQINPCKPTRKNRFLSMSFKPRKKGLSDSQNFIKVRVNKRNSNPPTWWVKKCYFLLFSKYEIHKQRDLYRIHNKGRFKLINQ